MAVDANDTKTMQLALNGEERAMLGDALKTHSEKIGRKASADAPKSIKELWSQELRKIEALIAKVTA